MAKIAHRLGVEQDFIGGNWRCLLQRGKGRFRYICRYNESHKQPPTIAEIGKQFQMTSSASVHSILSVLERDA